MSIINLKEGKLYQWDTGIKVVVSLPIDTNVKRIDFKSKAIKGIMSMKAIVENRKYVSEIPNEMLQHSEEITAYVVISHSGDEERTIFHRSFTVKPKDKPPGYVCDQQEILRFESLEARIKALEEGNTGGGIAEETDPTVPAWAKEPTKPTYTAEEVGAYSKEEIDNMFKSIVDGNEVAY